MSKHSHQRSTLRQLRRSLSPEQQFLAAENLLEHIFEDDDFKNASNIAFYQAFDGEINPSSALQAALKQGKHIFLPIISPTNSSLTFVEYQTKSSLTKNAYGILEPELYPNNALAPEHIDIIFMPLVAFDLNGTRLGMGKGYYDRSLAFILEKKSEKSLSSIKIPNLIGLGHECQRVEHLERAEWDVPLDKIITDQAIYTFAN
ncbi:MAG: 5-formyltetrahydrofolate cyclo-ligase [Gammaproteobacteria bacterium]|nr:5-formyltetrahydrofolate cyclo-ligase [Gammaproteobacteria bacterium]